MFLGPRGWSLWIRSILSPGVMCYEAAYPCYLHFEAQGVLGDVVHCVAVSLCHFGLKEWSWVGQSQKV